MTTTSLFDEEEPATDDQEPSAVPETPAARRVFRYDHHTIPDPGIALSIEDVRKALVLYFPDLVQATTTTATEGDTQVITFTKQTTHKGTAGETPPSDLTKRLLALDPVPDTFADLALPDTLTLAQLAARRDDIRTALDTRAEALPRYERIYLRCLVLPATPLLTRLPLGF